MTEITLPNNWRPRLYQQKLWDYLEAGGTRAIEIAHRRWGKDDVALHWTAVSAMQRPAVYWHMLPEASQARKAIWTAVNPKTGKRRMDEAFPHDIREQTLENEMMIRFKNGSLWQVLGSDNYESLVGTPPAGIVFSEWAMAVPASWAYLAPILAENEGWALFITTPRGRNHAQKTLQLAQSDPRWFAEISTVTDTGAISLETVEDQRRQYHQIFGEDEGDSLIQQEYFCSFEAAVQGAYYGRQITAAETEGRICKLDVDKDLPVHSAWDIGVADATAIWCFQKNGPDLHVVDYYEANGQGVAHYVDWLKQRGYRGNIFVPHDAKVKEWGSGKTRIETMKTLWGKYPHVVRSVSLQDGIHAARETLRTAKFDATRCHKGLEALRNYKTEWDAEARVYKKTPAHDWSSHGADAWRYLSLQLRDPMPKSEQPFVSNELIYTGMPGGRIVGNLTVRQAVEAMIRRRGHEAMN
jgi:phage terminase large subunit